MTGRMSLDVSEILIKFGNFSRVFELFGYAILDSVSGNKFTCRMYTSQAFSVFLSRVRPGSSGAKVTLRHSVLSVKYLNIPKFLQALVGV